MGEEVYVGIDVSKTELVVAVRPSGHSFTLAYDRVGLKHLVGRLGKLQPKLVVVEATGGLQRQVVAALWTAGVAVAAVNPSWVRSYARGSGLLAQDRPHRCQATRTVCATRATRAAAAAGCGDPGAAGIGDPARPIARDARGGATAAAARQRAGP